MKNTIVGLKELRENIDKYISQVEKGDSFTVMRKSKPVFKISPLGESDMWETIADFTKIKMDKHASNGCDIAALASLRVSPFRFPASTDSKGECCFVPDLTRFPDGPVLQDRNS